MNNWHLLLLAFVAVLQSTASLTEKVIDGRRLCEQKLHSPLRDHSRVIDGSLRLDKASSEQRRVNRNANGPINQSEATLSSLSATRVRRQLIDSPKRLGTQHRYEKANIDNKRLDHRITHTIIRRYSVDRNTRRVRETLNTQNIRRGNEVRRASTLRKSRISAKREVNGMSRGEPFYINRNIKSSARGTTPQEETKRSEMLGRKILAKGTRSRENEIKSGRFASFSNTRINKNILDDGYFVQRRSRVNFIRLRSPVQDVANRQQSNENRGSKVTSGRRNISKRMPHRKTQQNSLTTEYATDKIPNIQDKDIPKNVYNTIQKRLESRQEKAIRNVKSRRTTGEVLKNQDIGLERRTRRYIRKDYRDESLVVRSTRSTKPIRDGPRMQTKYNVLHDTTEREFTDIRNLKAVRIRDNVNVNEKQIKNESYASWLNILYTLQGIYLCGLFLQLFNRDDSKKNKSRILQCWWFPSSRSIIKVE